MLSGVISCERFGCAENILGPGKYFYHDNRHNEQLGNGLSNIRKPRVCG